MRPSAGGMKPGIFTSDKTAPAPAWFVRPSARACFHSPDRKQLFVSMGRACAGSLGGENACRRATMERADTTTDELLKALRGEFNRLRQAGIDEELFDVISGCEALSK